MLYENKQYENLVIDTSQIKKHKYIDCTFVNCNFSNLELIETEIINCTFTNCKLNSLVSKNSFIKNATFTNSDIVVIDWNSFLAKSTINNLFYEIRNCNLVYNNFIKLNLNKFSFNNNVILKSLFEETNLVGSKFLNCHLEGTQFLNSNLANSDLSSATDYYIDIKTCNLKKAKFSFPEVTNLLNSLEIIIN